MKIKNAYLKNSGIKNIFHGSTLIWSSLQQPTAFIDKFSFSLTEPKITSAGVYNQDNVLVRTLWSAIPFEAGTYIELWDGKDDLGNIAIGTFEARVLSHNVNYNWEGVWANTSDDQIGDTIHNSLDSIVGIRIMQHTNGKMMAVYAAGYGEGEAAEGFFYLDEPQKKFITPLVYGKSQSIDFITSNSTKIFRAAKDVFDDQQCSTFVYATDKASSDFITFSSGTRVQTVLGTDYQSAIGTNKQAGYDSSNISGIAANDSYLYISRKEINRISIINANTGTLISNVTVTKPTAVYILGSNLWCGINSNTVIRRPINSDGTLGTVNLTLSGFSNVLDINSFGSNITIVDGGISQQIKTYNATTGASVWVRGQLGGYTGSGNKEIFNDKWMFNRIAALYAPIVECSGIAFEPDGSYWLCDPGNMRIQHFTSDGTFINSINHEMRGYHVKLNKNNDKFILATHRVIEVDPTKPIKEGWKLKYNFQDSSNTNPVDDFTTLSNGRMYGTRRINIQGQQTIVKIVELNTATGIRETKVTIPDGTYRMYEDGSIRWTNDISNGAPRGGQQWWRKNLISFDSDNDPLYGSDIKEEEISLQLSDPKAYSPISKDNSYRTDNGNLWSYDSHISSFDKPNQYRLGSHKNGKFLVKTMLTVEANHKGDFPENGELDWSNYNRESDNSVTGYYGSKLMIYGKHVVAGVHGEFWRNGQLNKYIHYHEDGLLIAVAGEQRPQNDRRGNIAYQAGNAHTPNLHYYQEDNSLNIIHGTENGHQGLHRIKILNTSSINIQKGLPSTATPRVLTGVNLLEDFTKNENITGNKGRWIIPTPFNTNFQNRFEVILGSLSTSRYRLDGTDIKFNFIMPSGSARTIDCSLGSNTNLNSWSIKGLIEFEGNERNDPEGTSGYVIEVLDSSNLVIADFYHRREPEFFKTTFRGNNVIMKTCDEDNSNKIIKQQSVLDMDNLRHHRNFEISSKNSNILFKYADFPELTTTIKNTSSNIKNPKTLRIRFFTQDTPYLRTLGFYKLRFFNS